MAKLSEEHSSLLKELGYEPVDDDTDRLLFRNAEADAEVTIVEVVGQFHFDFAGFSMLGERTAKQDLILSRDLLENLTRESRMGKELADGG